MIKLVKNDRTNLEKDVSVIIVNYHTSHLINDCVKSIFKHTKNISYEIIIVDNHTENLSEVIRTSHDYRVHLLQLPDNIGFGRANNAGAEIANGRNIFLLNPDTILLNNAIKILSDYLDNNPNCGACGGNLFDKNEKPLFSFRRILPGIRCDINELFNLYPERILYKNNRVHNYTEIPLSVGYITGADLMIPTKLYRQLGGFSDKFFMYYEETDLCYRIKREKLNVMSVPNAKIIHLEGASFENARLNPARIERIESGRQIYYRRNFNKVHRIISNSIYFFFLQTRLLLKSSRKDEYRLRLHHLMSYKSSI